MKLKTISIHENVYQDYLSGKEVVCDVSHMSNRDLAEGEHVLVYRNTLAAHTDVTTPTREAQADYIGIEGVITQVGKHRTAFQNTPDHVEQVTVKKL